MRHPLVQASLTSPTLILDCGPFLAISRKGGLHIHSFRRAQYPPGLILDAMGPSWPSPGRVDYTSTRSGEPNTL